MRRTARSRRWKDTLDGAAAALFAAGIAARTGKVYCALPVRPLFTPTLSQAGLKSDRVFYLEGGDDKTVPASATAEATLSWRKSLG